MRAHVTKRERIAVGRRPRGADGAHRSAGADHVLDHDLLAEGTRHVLAENSRDRIGGSAGGERHDHRDGAGRVILPGSRSAEGRCGHAAKRGEAYEETHVLSPSIRAERSMAGYSTKTSSRFLRIIGSAASTSMRPRSDEHAGDRPGEEHGRVAARDQHGAAQILLHQRPEHEAEQRRRRLEIMLDQPVADQTEDAPP